MKHLLLAAALLCGVGTVRAESLSGFIDRHAALHGFSGSILVQQDGAVRYRRSFGRAERAFDTPNADDTRYRIASITKLFTATLILQLVDRGKLDLDAPFGTYLPDTGNAAADRITVHQLLNHTSGLPNFDTVKDAATALRDGIPQYQRPHTGAQLLARSLGTPVSAPGAAFDYNNGDYIVLGRIIERIENAAFERVLRERILEPLDLRDTGLLRQQDIVPRLASAYFVRDDIGGLAPDLPVYPENWDAAGAMYSTAPDLLAFANALFGGRLLQPGSLARLTAPGLDDYGYGLWCYDTVIDDRPVRVAKRPGSIMGAQAQLFRFLDSDTTIVLLANTSEADLDTFVAQIARRLKR